MRIQKNDLITASTQTDLTELQIENLWQALEKTQTSHQKSTISTALLWLGTLIAFLSMTWFYTANMKNSASLFTAIAYAFIFFGTGAYLWYRKKMKTPGALLSCLGISMIPFIIYALQHLLNWWPSQQKYRGFYLWADGQWIPMEICTLLVACLTFYFIRSRFVTILLYLTVWFLCMDVASLMTNSEKWFSIISFIIGLSLNALGFKLYQRNQGEYGFWSYFFGMFICLVGISAWDYKTEFGYFIFFLINLGFLLISGFFHRKIFMTFSLLGIVGYLGHLTWVFYDSSMFSYVVAMAGFGLILLAIFLQKSKKIAALK